MNEAALAILISVTVALMVRGLSTREGFLRYSFLVALVMAGWFIPQAIGLLDDESLPENGFSLTMLYAAACLAAVYNGESKYRYKPRPIYTYNSNKLLIGAGVLSVIGLWAYAQIFSVELKYTEEGLTTGTFTILYFFSKLQYFGLGIAVLVLLRGWSWPAFLIVALTMNSVLGIILFGGRRGPAVDVALIVLCMLWFQRRILVPRAILLGCAALGALFVNVAGQYRSIVSKTGRLPTFDELMAIDFLGAFFAVTRDGFHEVRNAIMYVIATFESFNYNFGAGYWNYLVFSYVPGQIVGANVKSALMFNLPDNPVEVFGYQRHIGTTFTGFADSFVAFSFLGVLVFFAFSKLLTNWWHRANAGDERGQALYAVSLATALHGVTHGTQWFAVFLMQLVIFVIPIFRWAKTGTAQPKMVTSPRTRLKLARQPTPTPPRFNL
jgi:hypothetical protein